MIGESKALHDYLRIKTLIQGAVTVFGLTTLGLRRVELDYTNLHVKVRDILTVPSLTYRADGVTRVHHIPDIHRDMEQMGILNLQRSNRPLERVHRQPLYPLVCSYYDYPAL